MRCNQSDQELMGSWYPSSSQDRFQQFVDGAITKAGDQVTRFSSMKSEGAMAAGGSNATASDSGAFNALYSDDSSEREHQEAPVHPGDPDTQSE